MATFEANLQRNLAYAHLKVAQKIGVQVDYHTSDGDVYRLWATKQYVETDSQDSLDMDVEKRTVTFYIARQLDGTEQWPPSNGLQIREHIVWSDLNSEQHEFVIAKIINGDSVQAVYQFDCNEDLALVNAV